MRHDYSGVASQQEIKKRKYGNQEKANAGDEFGLLASFATAGVAKVSKEVVFSVSIEVTNDTVGKTYSTTVPIAAVSISVGQDGSSWSTEIWDGRAPMPFVRIDPGSRMSLSIRMTASRALESTILASGGTALQEVAAAFGPGTSLATALAKPEIEQKAKVLDLVLNRLFSSRTTEIENYSLSEKEWRRRPEVWLDFYLPVIDRSANPVDTALRRIGSWSIGLEQPRASMFAYDSAIKDKCSEQQEAQTPVFTKLLPEHVLNFQLRDATTLVEHLRADSDRSIRLAHLKDYGDSTDATRKSQLRADVLKLCTDVKQALNAQGFNRDDAIVGLWAVLATSPNSRTTFQDLYSEQACEIPTMAGLGLISSGGGR